MTMTMAEARKLVSRLNGQDRDRDYRWRVKKVDGDTVHVRNSFDEGTVSTSALREKFGNDDDYAYETPFYAVIEESQATSEKGYFVNVYMAKCVTYGKIEFPARWAHWYFTKLVDAKAHLESNAWKGVATKNLAEYEVWQLKGIIAKLEAA